MTCYTPSDGYEPGTLARNPKHNAIRVRNAMKVFRTTLDERSAQKVTRAAKRMGISESAYLRCLVHASLQDTNETEMERLDREGYRQFPIKSVEFL
jgi:hypothetical protein